MAEEKEKKIGHYKKELKKAEKNLDEAYKSLGVRTYNLAKEGKLKAKELSEVIRTVETVLGELAFNQSVVDKMTAERKGAKCPYCGHKSAPGTRFCPNCGRDLPEADTKAAHVGTKCPECGMVMEDPRYTYCNRCGAKLQSE